MFWMYFNKQHQAVCRCRDRVPFWLHVFLLLLVSAFGACLFMNKMDDKWTWPTCNTIEVQTKHSKVQRWMQKSEVVTWQFQIVFDAINFNKKKIVLMFVSVFVVGIRVLVVSWCPNEFSIKFHASIGIRSLTDYFDANEKILKFKWCAVAYSRRCMQKSCRSRSKSSACREQKNGNDSLSLALVHTRTNKRTEREREREKISLNKNCK